jgi:3-methyladenine DNA glycosylase AlkD
MAKPADSPNGATRELVAFVRRELAARAVPERAPEMAAYMKSAMPFLGVSAPRLRAVAKEAARRFPVADGEAYERAVLALWRLEHREEKHVAVAVARHHRVFVAARSLGLYERLVREGAWWDFVDEVAPHLVGVALAREPDAVWPVVEQWIDDPDMWVRRAAILCQLGFKERTDARRLFAFCLRRAGEREFFIRKAIGWALRQYARTEPGAVRRFLDEHGGELAPLSVREASKHL